MNNYVQGVLNAVTSSAFDSDGKLLPKFQMAVSKPSKRQEALVEAQALEESLDTLAHELDSLYAKALKTDHQGPLLKKMIKDTREAYRLTYEAMVSLKEVYQLL